MSALSQSRKWQLTINNPAEHEFAQEKIIKLCSEISSIKYFCLCDEIGESGTYHTHIFIVTGNPKRFETIKNLFPAAHIEACKGTSQENRDYIRKEGKHEKDNCQNLKETFYEWGEIPVESQGKRTDMLLLYERLRDGCSDDEIIQENPNLIKHIEKFNKVRQSINTEKYKTIFRQLEVNYIFGLPRTGKTRYVMDKYGYENVYRVTNYDRNPFDSYQSQDVLLLDEYRTSIPTTQLLPMLEGYPLELPARFQNRTACYTKVYIVTNIPWSMQHKVDRKYEPITYQALQARINNFYKMTEYGITIDEFYHPMKPVSIEEFNKQYNQEKIGE